MTKWIVLVRHGNFASDVSKMNMEKFAVITTDPEMDNAVSINDTSLLNDLKVTLIDLGLIFTIYFRKR